MTHTIKKVLMAGTAVAALALGGSAIAGAVSSDSGTTTQQSGTTTQEDDATAEDRGTGNDRGRNGGQRSDETLLTGDTATQVREAALAETGGGTIERVETDADGNAPYEAHMVKSDGSRVTVYVDEQFNVVSVDESGGPGGHARGDEQGADSDSDAQQNGNSQGTNA